MFGTHEAEPFVCDPCVRLMFRGRSSPMSAVTSSQPLCVDASSLRAFNAPAANPRDAATVRTIRFADAAQLAEPRVISGKVVSAKRRLWSLAANEAALDLALDRMIDAITKSPRA